jgi:hypothetical protein
MWVPAVSLSGRGRLLRGLAAACWAGGGPLRCAARRAKRAAAYCCCAAGLLGWLARLRGLGCCGLLG